MVSKPHPFVSALLTPPLAAVMRMLFQYFLDGGTAIPYGLPDGRYYKITLADSSEEEYRHLGAEIKAQADELRRRSNPINSN